MGRERSSELDRVRDEDLGMVLREEICKFLDLVGVPRGLAMVGYKSEDVSRVGLSVDITGLALTDSWSRECFLRRESWI
jgi:hypothetical protein